MNQNDFNMLLMLVQGKDIGDALGADVKEILGKLLNGEFRNIEVKKVTIRFKKPKGGGRAAIYSKDGKIYLWVNPENWETNPDFSNECLEMVLRHELLHVELDGTSCKDERFVKEARKRNIELWG